MNKTGALTLLPNSLAVFGSTVARLAKAAALNLFPVKPCKARLAAINRGGVGTSEQRVQNSSIENHKFANSRLFSIYTWAIGEKSQQIRTGFRLNVCCKMSIRLTFLRHLNTHTNWHHTSRKATSCRRELINA